MGLLTGATIERWGAGTGLLFGNRAGRVFALLEDGLEVGFGAILLDLLLLFLEKTFQPRGHHAVLLLNHLYNIFPNTILLESRDFNLGASDLRGFLMGNGLNLIVKNLCYSLIKLHWCCELLFHALNLLYGNVVNPNVLFYDFSVSWGYRLPRAQLLQVRYLVFEFVYFEDLVLAVGLALELTVVGYGRLHYDYYLVEKRFLLLNQSMLKLLIIITLFSNIKLSHF